MHWPLEAPKRSQGICQVSRAKAERSRQAFKTWQVDTVLEQRLVCFSLLTTLGPGLSRDVSWPGHCRSPVFLANDCGETWCGDRGETGLKGFVNICAKERWEAFSYHGPSKQRGHAKKSAGKNVKDGRAKGHLQHSKASHYQGSGDFPIYPLPYLRFVVKLEAKFG